MEWSVREQHFKVFENYMDVLKGRSCKYFIPGSSKYHDKKIKKFMDTYKVPFSQEDVIIFLDTTVFRTANEGFLFTTQGIIAKVTMEKLFFLAFAKMERAEVEEIVDEETAAVTRKIKIIFKDGTSQNVFPYDLRIDFFVDYVNDAIMLWNNLEAKDGRTTKLAQAGTVDRDVQKYEE